MNLLISLFIENNDQEFPGRQKFSNFFSLSYAMCKYFVDSEHIHLQVTPLMSARNFTLHSLSLNKNNKNSDIFNVK